MRLKQDDRCESIRIRVNQLLKVRQHTAKGQRRKRNDRFQLRRRVGDQGRLPGGSDI